MTILPSKPLIGVKPDLSHPYAKNLQAYWLMNDMSGPQVLDLSGHKHHGFMQNNYIWFGDALNVNLVNTIWVNCAVTDFPTIDSGNYTVMAIVLLPISLPADYGAILAFDDINPFWGRFTAADSKLAIYDGGFKDRSTTQINDGLWHQVAYVRNGTGANETEFFLDGKSDGLTTHADAIVLPSTLRIGHSPSATYLSGGIWSVMIWDRALPHKEVDDFQTDPLLLFPDDIIDYMEMVVGRTTKNTDVMNLGQRHGMSFRMSNSQ